ncbi:MAG: 50S ribosomal protein L21 [bacterium]
MFAVVSLNGIQYKVMAEKEYDIALMGETEENKLTFTEVLLVSDDKKVTIGAPFIKDAKVEAEILGETTGKKVESIKFKAKKRYKRNLGHKQHYTKIKILSINL